MNQHTHHPAQTLHRTSSIFVRSFESTAIRTSAQKRIKSIPSGKPLKPARVSSDLLSPYFVHRSASLKSSDPRSSKSRIITPLNHLQTKTVIDIIAEPLAAKRSAGEYPWNEDPFRENSERLGDILSCVIVRAPDVSVLNERNFVNDKLISVVVFPTA